MTVADDVRMPGWAGEDGLLTSSATDSVAAGTSGIW